MRQVAPLGWAMLRAMIYDHCAEGEVIAKKIVNQLHASRMCGLFIGLQRSLVSAPHWGVEVEFKSLGPTIFLPFFFSDFSNLSFRYYFEV